MKKRMEFVCEICDFTSYNQEAVERCEKNHIKPIEIVKVEYARGEQYPLVVKVRFDNGSTRDMIFPR